MVPEPGDFDWSVAGWEGSRRAQVRRWMSFTVRERLQMIEGMAQLARRLERVREAGAGGPAAACEPGGDSC